MINTKAKNIETKSFVLRRDMMDWLERNPEKFIYNIIFGDLYIVFYKKEGVE